MKHLWLVIILLAAGCSDNSDNAVQPTNNVESANESANKQIETQLSTRYTAVSNWEKNLPRHGTTSAVFSCDVQKAITSSLPILFTAHLHDVATGTNGMFYAELTQRYNRDKSASNPDFELILSIQLTDEQAQKILNPQKDVFSDEYAVVAKISNIESSAQYSDVNDDWPTLYVEGKCIDFSLLK
jgi:PBP1b-binding outer membrane lipoprotein LpoB